MILFGLLALKTGVGRNEEFRIAKSERETARRGSAHG